MQKITLFKGKLKAQDQMNPAYALWAEFMPYHWVAGDLPLLRKHALALNLAIPSSQIASPELRALLLQAALLEVPVRAWLLLPDAQGYWPHAGNAEIFAQTAHRLMDWIDAEKLPLPVLIADLEPSLADSLHLRQLLLQRHLPALWAHLRQSQRALKLAAAREVFNRLIHELHQRGTQAWAVTYPLVVEDAQAGNTCFQELLQLPVTGVNWDALSLMTYRSSFRDLLGFSLSPHFVKGYFEDARKCFQQPLQAALGVVGTVGKLSESGYHDPAELAADCEAARQAGVSEIQIFSLDGMHHALTPADWLGALRRETLLTTRPDWASRGLRSLLRLSNALLAQGRPDAVAGPAKIFRLQKELQAALSGTDGNAIKYLRQLINQNRIGLFRPER